MNNDLRERVVKISLTAEAEMEPVVKAFQESVAPMAAYAEQFKTSLDSVYDQFLFNDLYKSQFNDHSIKLRRVASVIGDSMVKLPAISTGFDFHSSDVYNECAVGVSTIYEEDEESQSEISIAEVGEDVEDQNLFLELALSDQELAFAKRKTESVIEEEYYNVLVNQGLNGLDSLEAHEKRLIRLIETIETELYLTDPKEHANDVAILEVYSKDLKILRRVIRRSMLLGCSYDSKSVVQSQDQLSMRDIVCLDSENSVSLEVETNSPEKPGTQQKSTRREFTERLVNQRKRDIVQILLIEKRDVKFLKEMFDENEQRYMRKYFQDGNEKIGWPGKDMDLWREISQIWKEELNM